MKHISKPVFEFCTGVEQQELPTRTGFLINKIANTDERASKTPRIRQRIWNNYTSSRVSRHDTSSIRNSGFTNKRKENGLIRKKATKAYSQPVKSQNTRRFPRSTGSVRRLLESNKSGHREHAYTERK